MIEQITSTLNHINSGINKADPSIYVYLFSQNQAYNSQLLSARIWNCVSSIVSSSGLVIIQPKEVLE